MRKHVPYIEQMEHSECGLACLAMVLGYYKHHVSLNELRDEFGFPKGGGSFYHLSMMAEKKGMHSKGYVCDTEMLNQLPLPVILHWENKHFVVLEKIRGNSFQIVDPAQGRRTFKKAEFNELYSGQVLSLIPGEHFQERKKEKNISFFIEVLKKEKKKLVLILVISLLLQGAAVAIPMLTRWITDEVLVMGKQSLLTIFGYSILVIFAMNLLFSSLRGVVIAKLQTKMDSFMMSKFIDKLFKLPYTFFENRSSGELLFRSNLNVYIRQILSTNAITFFIDLILLVTYTILMFVYSPILSGIVITVGVILFVVLLLNTRIIKSLSDKNVTSQAEVQKYLSEHIYGISDVKMLGLETTVFDNWKKKFHVQLETSEKRGIWMSSIQAFSTSIQFILPLFLLWFGGFMVLQGDLSIGTLIAFNSMAGAFIAPIISISTSYTDLINVSSYIQRLMDVITSKPEQEDYEIDGKVKGEIEVRNVSFSYDSFSEKVLENITFTANIGEKVAIVGPSGSGKSTLAKLILGFYQPTEGSVLYDGIQIEKYNYKQLRTQIGAVLQESRLFNETVYENIIMGHHENYEYLEETLVKTNVNQVIRNLPLGILTKISENGSNFSGGQRQRLILARALVKKPKILVLDEATSALDAVSERIIDDNISSLPITRIIIAHRLSTIKDADKIIVLHEGKIAEVGKHDELIKNKGVYYQLYGTQTEDREKKLVEA